MAPKKNRVRLKERRRRASYLVVGASFALFCAVIGGVAYATRLPDVTVQSVVVSGTTLADESAVKSEVERVLGGSYLLLVPKRMSYVVPKGAIAASLIAAFPEIEGAQVSVTSENVVDVRVTERSAVALWCADTCYQMDEYGYIFEPATGNEALRHYSGLVENPVGSTYLGGDFHDFSALVDDLEKATSRTVVAVETDELDAFVRFREGGELRFVRGTDRETLLAEVASVFGSPDFRAGRAFKYVELRFGNNAAVQFE